jgi:hypothetical protein
MIGISFHSFNVGEGLHCDRLLLVPRQCGTQ